MIDVRLRVPLDGNDPLLELYGISRRVRIVPARATVRVVELEGERALLCYRGRRYWVPRETLRRHSYTPRGADRVRSAGRDAPAA